MRKQKIKPNVSTKNNIAREDDEDGEGFIGNGDGYNFARDFADIGADEIDMDD